MTGPDESGSRERAVHLFRCSWLALLFAIGAIGTAYLTTHALSDPVTSPRGLAGLLLGGAVTFFLALGALVALFHALRLTNKRHPLGLPDGSVQALMALTLILLFFIMAVFLYLDVSQTSTERRLTGLTQESVESIPQEQIVSVVQREEVVAVDDQGNVQTETRYDVLLVSPRATSDVAQEIARQLVTSLGTLIAAIAAFYFGAKTVGGRSPDEPSPAERPQELDQASPER